nr:uncharacterized protein LOC111429028 [Onthophagus taurus]
MKLIIVVALLITCALAHPRTPYRLKSSTTTTTEETISELEDDLATVADVVTEEIAELENHEVTVTLSENECKEVNNIFSGRNKRDALDRIRLKNKFRKACTFAVIAG